jgi:regulator of replication initiation timing
MPLGKGKYKVSAYLSQQELELLESLCQMWHCNKSQAVIRSIKILASNPSHSNESHFNSVQRNGVTRDEFENTIAPIKSQVDDLKKYLTDELTEFDKAFQSLGSKVHDQILSLPIVTKEELQKAIAPIQYELEHLMRQDTSLLERVTELESENQSKRQLLDYSSQDDLPDMKTITNDQSNQGISKASLDTIFDDGLSVDLLAEQLGMTRQAVEYKRDKEILEQLGYKAIKEGKRWKYYKID